MYSKSVSEPADRECDDLWAGHYVTAPMRATLSELTRERERGGGGGGVTEKGIGKDNIHTEGKREGRREQKHACTHTNMLIQVSYTTMKT